MKVTSRTNTLLSLTSKANPIVIFVWCTIICLFVLSPNIEQLLLVRTPLQFLAQPILYVPFILTTLVYAVSVKKSVHFDRTSNNIYIEETSLLKKTQKQVPFMQVSSVEGIERTHYSNKKVSYYYDIFLNLKDSTSVLVGASTKKYSAKERELNQPDPLLTEISTFLGVTYKTTKINMEDILGPLNRTNAKMPALVKLVMHNGISPRITIGNNTTPQDHAQLKQLTEQMAMHLLNKKSSNGVIQPTDKTFNNLDSVQQQNQTKNNTDTFATNTDPFKSI